ncbi:MAG: hypothetical protein IT425_10765, partial [Pirellulales bacterium]|nr:hypothetical protein [Pirellulales bacterium]
MAEGESRHFIACPKCSARFAVAEAMAGRRARCKACNQAFRVPRFGANEHHEATSEPVSPPSSSTIERPRLVSVECRVCGTLMYGRLEHVGKKVKCPDCGAGTVLPQPPPPKQPNIPAAMLGEQYELWEEDEQPLPSEMIASEPKYIGISCSICGTLMYAP